MDRSPSVLRQIATVAVAVLFVSTTGQPAYAEACVCQPAANETCVQLAGNCIYLSLADSPNAEPPVEFFDFTIDTGTPGGKSFPVVDLHRGASQWRVYVKGSQPGGLGDFGGVRVTNDRTENFTVRVLDRDGGHGVFSIGTLLARGTLELTPAPGFRSNLVVDAIQILNADVTVQDDGAGEGGFLKMDVGAPGDDSWGVFIGDVNASDVGHIAIKRRFGGQINIDGRLRVPANPAEGDGIMSIGEQGIEACVLGSQRGLTLPGTPSGLQLPDGSTFTPQLPMGPITIDTIDADAQLFHYAALRSSLQITTLDGSLFVEGTVGPSPSLFEPTVALGNVNAGATAVFGDNSPTPCRFEGALRLRHGIAAGGTVTLRGPLVRGTDFDGVVQFGDLISNPPVDNTLAGTFELLGGGDGRISGPPVVTSTGIVTLADGAGRSYSGVATFIAVDAGGIIQTLNGATFDGDLTIARNQNGGVSGAMNGAMNWSGDVSGSMKMSGDMGGTIDIGGALSDGWIEIIGQCDGAITIMEGTGPSTVISAGGLGATGTIKLNAVNEQVPLDNDFLVEGNVVIGALSPMTCTQNCQFGGYPITFDGCIEIFRGEFVTDPLIGRVQVNGCHPKYTTLNICVYRYGNSPQAGPNPAPPPEPIPLPNIALNECCCNYEATVDSSCTNPCPS